jgi:FLYWCH zinc finger domain
MAFILGTSSKGKRTLIYKNYEYVKECGNVNGTVSWRCRFVKKFKCKARLVSLDDRVVAEKQPEHTHGGNIATSMARKAVGGDEGFYERFDGDTERVSGFCLCYIVR